MLKTGMIIAERYEIVGKSVIGGMADVYKAMDHKLNRFVAVKVLKPEFREDATFVKKFRSEAQAAAGLTHPNIVNVFDVGDDERVFIMYRNGADRGESLLRRYFQATKLQETGKGSAQYCHSGIYGT